MFYIAVDIGCIECGEETSVLGIFTEEARAEEACKEHEIRQRDKWRGQHSFEVFKIESIGQLNKVEY